jgi:hypothetical protein
MGNERTLNRRVGQKPEESDYSSERRRNTDSMHWASVQSRPRFRIHLSPPSSPPRFRTFRIIDRNPPVCAQFGINAWTRRAAPAEQIVGIWQDLSAIDFDRSMDVRSHFAFIDRPKLRGTREHTPARPSPRRATVRASDDLPPLQETEAGLGEQFWLLSDNCIPFCCSRG